MAEQRSRFEQIYRQKTKEGEGTFSALGEAARERAKERADLRRLFPNTGMLGAMLESAFGKAYKAGAKDAKKDSKPASERGVASFEDKSLTVIRMNTTIMAKNSMVLPGMARDMNVMRQNITRLTKHTTGSAATKADIHFLRAKEREAAYESVISKSSPDKPAESAESKKSGLGGFLANIGNIGGGLISGIGGLASGILSAFGSLIGGVVGGSLRIFGGILGGMGIFAIPMAMLTGSLIMAIFKGINFQKTGGEFSSLFNHMFSGIGSMFSIDNKNSILGSIVQKIKSFFGMDEENPNEPSFFRKVANKLDEMFKTTKFNEGLDEIIATTKGLYADIEYYVKMMYRDVMIYTSSAFSVVGDIFKNVGKDISSAFFRWLDDNTQGIYMMLGGVVGSAFGLKGAAIGTAVGAAYGFIDKSLVSGEGQREKAVKTLNEKIATKENRISQLKSGTPTLPGETLAKQEAELEELKKLLENKTQEIEARRPSGSIDAVSLFEKYKKEAESKFPKPEKPVSPIRIPQNMNDKELLEWIGKNEGGKFGYNALVYAQAGKTTPKSANLTEMKIEDVLKLQSKMIAEGHQSTAVGKYQIIKSTLEENLSEAGLTKQDLFSPENQDKLAMVLLNKRKKAAMENGKLNPERFRAELGKEWDFINKTSSSKIVVAENNLKNSIDENTETNKKLIELKEEEKEMQFSEILGAILEAMAASTTGTTVNNINNNTVSGGTVASAYNEDLLQIFKNRATQ